LDLNVLTESDNTTWLGKLKKLRNTKYYEVMNTQKRNENSKSKWKRYIQTDRQTTDMLTKITQTANKNKHTYR